MTNFTVRFYSNNPNEWKDIILSLDQIQELYHVYKNYYKHSTPLDLSFECSDIPEPPKRFEHSDISFRDGCFMISNHFDSNRCRLIYMVLPTKEETEKKQLYDKITDLLAFAREYPSNKAQLQKTAKELVEWLDG